MQDMNDVDWRKSSFCGSNACVEVARIGDVIMVRDSKNPTAAALRFDEAEWSAFERGVAAGEFRF